MKAITDQDAKNAKKSFSPPQVRHLANYDSADTLNHFKSDKRTKKMFKTFMKKILYEGSYHTRT